MLNSYPAAVPRDDEDSAKRQQILKGAGAVFMRLGFDGASMGEIARSAGVSKGTLYVYFADKCQLFAAIVEQETLQQATLAFDCDPDRDVTATLHGYGEAYMRMLCRPGGGSALRTVMAIAERMPDVGRRYYENMMTITIRRLAAYLDVHVKNGALDIKDTELAASQFQLACQASLFMPYIFQATPAPSDAEIIHVVDSATAMFLKTYSTRH